MEKRAAIFDDRMDEQLTAKEKAVYKYREERLKQWMSSIRAKKPYKSEGDFNEQYGEK
jgi:hypothetical protein